MSIQDYFQSLSERLHSSASVKSVFGDPVTVEGKTVIPVARIAYGIGGGSGICRRNGEQQTPSEGGGGGGGVMAAPAGVVEITAECTRFIPAVDVRRTGAAMLVGFALGALVFRCRSSK